MTNVVTHRQSDNDITNTFWIGWKISCDPFSSARKVKRVDIALFIEYQEFTAFLCFPTFRQLVVIGDIKGVRFPRRFFRFISDFEPHLYYESTLASFQCIEIKLFTCKQQCNIQDYY